MGQNLSRGSLPWPHLMSSPVSAAITPASKVVSPACFDAPDGSDWKHALSESEAFTVFVHPHDPNLVFAGTADGVYRSTDGGLSHRCRLSDFLTSHHSTLIAIPSGAEGSRLR